VTLSLIKQKQNKQENSRNVFSHTLRNHNSKSYHWTQSQGVGWPTWPLQALGQNPFLASSGVVAAAFLG
jgi:hypothetical protein